MTTWWSLVKVVSEWGEDTQGLKKYTLRIWQYEILLSFHWIQIQHSRAQPSPKGTNTDPTVHIPWNRPPARIKNSNLHEETNFSDRHGYNDAASLTFQYKCTSPPAPPPPSLSPSLSLSVSLPVSLSQLLSLYLSISPSTYMIVYRCNVM